MVPYPLAGMNMSVGVCWKELAFFPLLCRLSVLFFEMWS